MDYEKAYNEIVQRVKELHESGNALTKKQMEIIFPELAESEDERIRMKLCEFISDTLGDEFDGYDISKDAALAYLEKQKDKCKDCPSRGNTHSYLKGYEDGRKEQNLVDPFDDEQFKKGYEEGWYDSARLNKPIGLTSMDTVEACMLRYAQSATNCKDDLELMRYTKEYKQKLVELIQKPAEIPLMNGDADLYFDNWLQQKGQVSKRQCFEEGIKYAQSLQKPAEWSEEDEKMRRYAIRVLESGEKRYVQDSGCMPHWVEVIDWLKSLRPQKNITIEDVELLHTFLYAVKNNKSGCFTFTRLSEEQYEEVLRRFYNAKEEKK